MIRFNRLQGKIRERASQSAFLKQYYPILRNRIIDFLRFFQLAFIYGCKTSIRLHRIRHTCRKRNSPINRRMKQIADKMADNIVEGSATKKGWLYHDFPLPESGFFSHRKNSLARIKKISRAVPLYKARVLDIGCSSGGISIGIALLGASEVNGIDYDANAIALAKVAAEKYEISNAHFTYARAEAFPIAEVDIIIWLSNWMWIVKQLGLDYAKDLLFNIPNKSKAQFMVFESAADDGKAAIPGLTQQDIERFLLLCTPFTKIVNIGPFKDAWRKNGKERMVFICSEPKVVWKGKGAIIVRNDRFTVTKKYESDLQWAKNIESLCLRRLASYPFFPKLIEEGDDWITMEWVGNPVSSLTQLKQLGNIIEILSKEKIIHRDICNENLLFRDGRLFLIDFGWAIIDGREPPVTAKPGLGRGFYVHGKWDDSQAAKNIISMFEERERK